MSGYLKQRLKSALPNPNCSLWLWDERGERVVGVGPHSPEQAPVEEGPETQEHWWTYSSPVEFAQSPLGWLTLICPQPTPILFLKELAAQLGTLIHLPRSALAPVLDEGIAELHELSDRFNWTGLYYKVGDNLELACFRGEPTPHPVIPIASGLCGAAVRENATLNVGNVGEDDRYLSCDLRTRSELIVPLRNSTGEAIGEIDIDSWQEGEFSAEQVQAVERMANRLTPHVLELIQDV